MKTQLHLPPRGGGAKEEAPPGGASQRRQGLRALPCTSKDPRPGAGGLAKRIFPALPASCTAGQPAALTSPSGGHRVLSPGRETFAISDLTQSTPGEAEPSEA